MKTGTPMRTLIVMLLVHLIQCLAAVKAPKTAGSGQTKASFLRNKLPGASLLPECDGKQLGQAAGAAVAVALISKISPRGVWRTFDFWRRSLPLLVVCMSVFIHVHVAFPRSLIKLNEACFVFAIFLFISCNDPMTASHVCAYERKLTENHIHHGQTGSRKLKEKKS
jgi:hypothetical protein